MTRRQINEEELHTLYTLIGKGIWQTQNVEDALHNTIAIMHNIKERGIFTREEGEAFLTSHRAKTLGRLVKTSQKYQLMSQALQERLGKFNDERNWLIHRLVLQSREDLYVDQTRMILFKRIDKFGDEAGQMQKLIASELRDFCKSQGVDLEQVVRNAQKQISRLKGGLT